VNNNSERRINKFFVDHTADAKHSGFLVTTTENCVKSVMGFSRFEFKIEPRSSLEFVVSEEVSYVSNLSSTAELINLVNRRASGLIAKKVLKAETLEVLKGVVQRAEAKNALLSVEREWYSEKDWINWQTGSSVVPGGAVLDKTILDGVSQVLGMKAKISENQRQTEYNQKLIEKVFVNQARLRENIKSLEKANAQAKTALVARYLMDIEKEEDDLKNTRGILDKLEVEKASLEKLLLEKKAALVDLVKKGKIEEAVNVSTVIDSVKGNKGK